MKLISFEYVLAITNDRSSISQRLGAPNIKGAEFKDIELIDTGFGDDILTVL